MNLPLDIHLGHLTMNAFQINDIEALIRTLLGIQASLVAGSISGVIYLLARWREGLKTMRAAWDVPQDLEATKDVMVNLKRLEIRTLRAKTFVLIIPLITVGETILYYVGGLSGDLIIKIILSLYIIQVIYLVSVIGPPSLRVRLDVSRDD